MSTGYAPIDESSGVRWMPRASSFFLGSNNNRRVVVCADSFLCSVPCLVLSQSRWPLHTTDARTASIVPRRAIDTYRRIGSRTQE